MPVAEVYAHRISHHGEGAVWWPDGHLRMVDAQAGEVVDVMADGTLRRIHVGYYAGCVRPRVDGGGAVVGLDRGFALLDVDGTVRPVADAFTDTSLRMNEGNCDPDGNFWCGSMAWDGRDGAGTLYRLDVDGQVTSQVQDATIPNGLGWNPAGDLAYWNDTTTQTTWCFDWAWDVGLTGRRPFVRIPAEQGSPDGLTVDRFGGVWVALWGGNAVHRYDEHGTLDLVVEVAARQVSSCTIGGDQLDRLFITTSRQDLAEGDDPLAGSVFTADLGESTGMAALPFGG